MSDFIKRLKTLSPEEVEATHKNVSEDDNFAANFKAELDGLDAAGREEAKAILYGGEIASSEVPEGQQVSSTRKEASDKGFLERAGDVVKDATAGIASAIPFSTEAAAGVAAGIEVATGSSDSFSESYEENVSFGKKSKATSSENSPYAYGAGRIAGEIASTGLIAGKAVKSIGAVSNFAKGATNIGVDVIAETARQFSDSEKRTFEALGESATTAAIYSSIGVAGGLAIGKTLDGLGSIYAKQFKNLVSSRGLDKVNKKVNTFLAENKGRHSARSYAATIERVPGAKEAIESNNMQLAQDLITADLGRKSAQKASLLRETELSMGDVYGLGAKEVEMLEGSVIQPIDDFLKKELNDYDELSSLGRELDALQLDIKKIFRGEPKIKYDDMGNSLGESFDISPLRVSNLNEKLPQLERLLDAKSSLVNTARKAGINLNKEDLLGKVRNAKNAVRDADYHTMDPMAGQRAEMLRRLDPELEVLGHAKRVGDDVKGEMTDAASTISKTVVDSAFKITRQSGMISVVGGLGLYSVIGPAAIPVAALGVFAGNLATSPSMIGKANNLLNKSDVVEGTVGKLANIGKFYTDGPGARSSYYGSLMSRLLVSVSNEDRDTQKYVDALDSTQALLKRPLERTTSDFMAKKDAVLDILAIEKPSLKEDLEKALASNEDIGMIMEQIAKIPAASEIIKPGLGWDGITNDPAHKAQLEREISSQALISASDKVRLISGLRNNGIIPNFDELPQRQPKKYQPRKKGRKY